MPNRLIRLIACAALAACAAMPAAAADKIFNLPYQARTLDNGLRVIVVPTATPGTVSIQIPVQTGSRNEIEPGKTGFAHFFEHMMFRGTPTYPADAYGAVIKNAGADQNAYTSSDFTNYYTNFTTADLDRIIEVEADRFRNLAYSESQFRTEALAVKGEYLKNSSNPPVKAMERLAALAYGTHTYGHTAMGYLADIEQMPNQLDYSKTFFDRWYRPEYTTVIIVGDVEPDATLRLVERHWGDWKRGTHTATIPQEPPAERARHEHLQWEGPTLPWVFHGWRGPAFDDASRATPALMLLAELYFGATSDAYKRIVVDERWADQFAALPPMNKDPGQFVIAVRLTDAKHAQAVSDTIRTTLLRARTEPFDAERLAQAKSRVKYSFAAGLNSAASIGATLARFVQYDRDPETINRLYQQFDAVTPEDILAAANAVLVDRNRATFSLSNAAALDGANALDGIDAAVAAAAQPPASDIRTVELPTGSDLIDVSVQFATGAVHDPAGKRGLSMLTASMLAQGGSAQRSYDELQKALYPLAAGLNVQVDKEVVTFSGTVHRDNLQAWHAVVREMLLQPGFRAEDFQRLKQQQINAIRVTLRGNNDEELGKEALYEFVYGDRHPYGTLNLGHARDVEALTLDDVRAHHRAHYTRRNVVVALGGAYGEAYERRLLADLSTLPDAAVAMPEVPPAPAASQRRARIIAKETTAVAVSFGWPLALQRGDTDWPALWLARSYLGEHRNSSALLYNKIREQRGMNYGNYAYIEYFPGGMFAMQPNPNFPRRNDLFQVWLRPLRDNNDAVFATRAALFEIDRLVEHGMPAADFEATRTFLHKYVALLTASSSRRLGYALDSQWFGTAAFVDYVRAELQKLTLERVNAAIRTHLRTDAAQFVFVAKDAEALAATLASDAPTPVTYNSEKPAELLAEDAVIAALPLSLPRAQIEVIPADSVFE